MPKLSTYSTATLAQGDQLPIVDDPGGTPSTKLITASHAFTNLQAGLGFDTPTQSGTPPTYAPTASAMAAQFGKVLVTNQSVTNYITIPDGLPDNFYFFVYQAGTGSTVVQSNGTTIVSGITSSGDQLTATGAQRAVMEVRPYATDSYICVGNNLTTPPFANSYSVQVAAGSANYIAIPNPANYTGVSQRSWATWVKANVNSGSGHDIALLQSSNLQNQFSWDTGDQDFNVRINNSYQSIGGVTNINTNTWRLFSWTFDTGTVAFYIDGVFEGSLGGFPTAFNSYADVGWQLGFRDFAGYIDEFGIWDDVLTAPEFLQLYNSGTPISMASDTGNYTSSSALLHLYRMGDSDGGTGSTVTDVIGSIDLTLTGTAAFSTEIP